MARTNDEGFRLDDRGIARKTWKRKPPWRPTGWTPAPEPYIVPIEVEEEAWAEHRARRRARNLDQSYNPRELQTRAQRLAWKLAGGVLTKDALPDVRLMSDAQLAAFGKALVAADRFDWRGANARPEQIQPKSYRTWCIICGRGWGKTRCSSEAVREWCLARPGCHIAVIAKDHRSLRDVSFEGVSGLINVFPQDMWNARDYHKGLGDVSLKLLNGSIIYGFTSEAPDAIRGRAFDAAICDEYAAWARNKASDMLSQLWFCLRDSPDPRVIITTTPKRVPHVVDLIKQVRAGEEGMVLTTGKTSDNVALSQVAVDQLHRMYAGTRMGRQELDGELLTDVDNALWTLEMVEAARDDESLDVPPMIGVITGVDPSGSADGDATGVVTIGWDSSLVIHVLDNSTTGGSPAERYTAVCMSAYIHGATEIWSEAAYGGDNAVFGIQEQWKNLMEAGIITGSVCPPVRLSTLRGDKSARAMPVVTLYEQQMALPDRRRVVHPRPTLANGIAKLEDEMVTWSTESKKSPNAVDAFVHATRQAMLKLGMEQSVSRPNTARRVGEGTYRVF